MMILLNYLNMATTQIKEKTFITIPLRIILFLRVVLTWAPYSLLLQKLNAFHAARVGVKRKHILFLLKSARTELNICVPAACIRSFF